MEQTIFCPLRGKRVAFTPEEDVRQQFISWLINSKKYPRQLMAAEYNIYLNKKNFRCDIVVFDKRLNPLMIVECKAQNVKLDSSVIEQIIRYNMVLNVKYLVITNGLKIFACRLGDKKNQYEFITDIPEYNTLINFADSNSPLI